MSMRSNIGPRMDRLPISKWHYKVSLVANSAPPIAILVAYLVMYFWLAGHVCNRWGCCINCMSSAAWASGSPRWYEARGEIAKADAILTQVEKEN